MVVEFRRSIWALIVPGIIHGGIYRAACLVSKFSIEKILRALLPFLVSMLALLLAVTFIDDISLLLTRFA